MQRTQLFCYVRWSIIGIHLGERTDHLVAVRLSDSSAVVQGWAAANATRHGTHRSWFADCAGLQAGDGVSCSLVVRRARCSWRQRSSVPPDSSYAGCSRSWLAGRLGPPALPSCGCCFLAVLFLRVAFFNLSRTPFSVAAQANA